MKYTAVVIVTLIVFVMRSVQPVAHAVGYGPCMAGWQLWERSCYKRLNSPLSCIKGLRSCQDLQAHLATPNSKEEHDFLFDLAVPVWIGCSPTSDNNEGYWECIGDTNDVKYRAEWHHHKNATSAERCAVVSGIYPKWYKWNCVNVLKNVVCERPLPVASLTCFIL